MPTYEYQYTRKNGHVVTLERLYVPMSQAAEPIEVLDTEDGNRYIAERIISAGGDMSLAWTDDVRNSDLPPKHYGPEDVKRDLAHRKSRKRRKKKASTRR